MWEDDELILFGSGSLDYLLYTLAKKPNITTQYYPSRLCTSNQNEPPKWSESS